MALFFVFAWIANIAALAVADWLFSGVSIDGWGPLLIGAAVLAIVWWVQRARHRVGKRSLG
jgi:uncharacterized membrane protein YvlD (DUF360 family)